ncbi:MAG: hypothetical protein HZB23_01730 [Deltaproteobacteria bacterium]|nr:hypothetical protein [Deltaproteobacteria bacterium]
MAAIENIAEVIRRHSTAAMLILVGFVLIEIQIMAIAVMKSGHKSTLQVMDQEGQVVYETSGTALSAFDRQYFEKNFGPLEKYQTRLDSKNVPFPFRAWFFAAVGIPIGVVFLVSFIIKAFAHLLYGDRVHAPPPERGDPLAGNNPIGLSPMDSFLKSISKQNVYILGALVFVVVFLLYAVPNFFLFLGKTSVQFIIDFKWVFLGGFAVLFGFVVWLVYLRFLLAKKNIDAHTEIQKLRVELEFKTQAINPAMEISYTPEKDAPPPALVPPPESTN